MFRFWKILALAVIAAGLPNVAAAAQERAPADCALAPAALGVNDSQSKRDPVGGDELEPSLENCAPSPGNPVDPVAECVARGLLGCTDSELTMSPPTDHGPLVGAIGGAVAAEPSGAASWSMGFGGPGGGSGLGIAFSSHGGDGPLGVGFSLTGLSSISRCAHTVAFDGFRQGVNWDVGDGQAKWCLDGTPLENVSSGTGTWDFRTQPDAGLVIRREGLWTDPTMAMVVYQRSGNTLTYGQRQSLDGTGAGAATTAFLLTGIEDPFGNISTFEWTVTPAGTVPRLSAVRWGANPGAGTPHLHTVTLEWEARPHATSGYVDGTRIEHQHRLAAVMVSGLAPDGTILEQYKRVSLDYRAAAFDRRTYLEQITVCEQFVGPAVDEWALCHQPTVFSWSGLKDDPAALSAVTSSTAPPLTNSTIMPLVVGYETPFALAEAPALRTYRIDGSGRPVFGVRTEATALPSIEFFGKIRFRWAPINDIEDELDFIRPDETYDPLLLVTDKDYFFESTSLECASSYPQGASDWCGIANLGAAEEQAVFDCVVLGFSDADTCAYDHPDYWKNRFFSAVRSTFATQLLDIARAGADLRGDFDCDGRMDSLAVDTFTSTTEIAYGDGSVAAGPAIAPTYSPDTDWGQLRNRDFWKEMSDFIADSADGLSGLFVLDMTGDGCSDIYQARGVDSAADHIFTRGTGTTWSRIDGPTTFLHDIDGPGADDRRARERSNDKSRIRFGNFNGDECTDVYYINGYGSTMGDGKVLDNVWLGDCQGGWQHRDGVRTQIRRDTDKKSMFGLTSVDLAAIQFGNFNDDACTDLYTNGQPSSRNSSTDVGNVWLSRCDGTFESSPMAGPVTYSFVGRQRVNNRSITRWQIGPAGDSNLSPDGLPPIQQITWAHDSTEARRVRLVDMNSDGLTDLYEFGRSASTPDIVHLNLGDGTWVPMDGMTSELSPPLTPMPWDAHSNVAYNLDRHLLTPLVGRSLMPGMHIGGEIIAPAGAIGWTTGPERYVPSAFGRPEMTMVTSGFGHQTRIGYTDLWPAHIQGHRRVVAWVATDTSATAGGVVSTEESRVEYEFSGLVIDPIDGSYGFGEVTSTEVSPPGPGRIRTVTTYWQDRYRRGLPRVTTSFVATAAGWAETAMTGQQMKVQFLQGLPDFPNRSPHSVRLLPDTDCTGTDGFWGSSITRDFANGNIASRSCTTTGPVDKWSNPEWTRVDTGDGNSTVTTFGYDGGDPDFHRRWGLPTSVQTVTTAWDGDVHCRVVWSAYDESTLARTAVTEPLVDDSCATTGTMRWSHFRRDAWGNVIEQKTGGTDVADRFSFADFGAEPALGLVSYEWAEIDGVAFGARFETNREFEVPTATYGDNTADPNQPLSETTFDGAGRVLRMDQHRGAGVTTFHGDQPSNAEQSVLGGAWRTWTVDDTGAWSYVVTDSHGREVRTARASVAGLIVSDSYYDSRGRKVEYSGAYVAASDEVVDRSELTVITSFDALDRPLIGVESSGLTAVWQYDLGGWGPVDPGPYAAAYQGPWVRHHRTTVDGAATVHVTDGSGQTLATQNALGETLWFDPNAAGEPTAFTDALGNETVAVIDNWGRATSVDEPDLGLRQVQYNALGETVRAINPDGAMVETFYDAYGRVDRLVSTNPDGSIFDVIETTWDDAPTVDGGQAIGLISRVASKVETVAYSYDDAGQLVSTTTAVTIGGQTEQRTLDVTFDSLGRSEIIDLGVGLTLRTSFDAFGESVGIDDVASGESLWRAFGRSDRGDIVFWQNHDESVTFHQADPLTGLLARLDVDGPFGQILELEFDRDLRGNVTELRDVTTGLTETFTHDALDRMRTSRVVGGPLVEYDFDQIGNLTRKTDFDAGPFAYAQTGNAGPHAVTSVGDRSFDYDLGGRLITEEQAGAVTRSLTYSPRGKVTTASTATSTLALIHGIGERKVGQVLSAGSDSTTTWYLGAGVRRISENGAMSTEVDIGTPVGSVGLWRAVDGQAPGVLTVHTDHLGSPSRFTNSAGQIVQSQAFTAYGQPRDPVTGVIVDAGTIDPLSEHGFSGHSRVDELGFVDMGARFYDPAMGRFVQPDTHTAEPLDNQHHARYTYVRGNPHRWIDPSGHTIGSFAGYLLLSIGLNTAGLHTVGVMPGTAGITTGGAASFNGTSFGGCGGGCGAPVMDTTGLGASMTGRPPWVPEDAQRVQLEGPGSAFDDAGWWESVDWGRVSKFGFGLWEYITGTARMTVKTPGRLVKVLRPSQYYLARAMQMNGIDDMQSSIFNSTSLKYKSGEQLGFLVGARSPKRVAATVDLGTGLVLIGGEAWVRALPFVRASGGRYVGDAHIGSGAPDPSMSPWFADPDAGPMIKTFSGESRLFVQQFDPNGCIAACLSMATRNLVSYSDWWSMAGHMRKYQSGRGIAVASEFLKNRGFGVRLIDSDVGMLRAAREADMGAEFIMTMRHSIDDGHAVVATKLANSTYLIRDPLGWVYTVNERWIDTWITGGLAF